MIQENLITFLQCNSVVEGIRKLNESSKHFIEISLERLYEYFSKEASETKISIGEDTEPSVISEDSL
ncbi:hypothetical protein AKJ57_05135 [candidate division MSBL1 archaeon SCGC-AAA259A05]|uniref:Uncharacterized protein n=1 Tax=candidate division MSBL1 archaeon SCGC-AAA259A05 TaxID=1698259 RepID=A0A133U5V7_9EURY|nr:hypothetical protein AKJ57_05135 [candidate division MSBL1 archaeon SCGC-AAA259A05]